MELVVVCLNMCRVAGIEVTDEMVLAFERWQDLFGREVYSYSDFVDALEVFDPALSGIDLEEGRRLWFLSHDLDAQVEMPV